MNPSQQGEIVLRSHGMSNNQFSSFPVYFLKSQFSSLFIALVLLFLFHTLVVDYLLMHYVLSGFLLMLLLAGISAFSNNTLTKRKTSMARKGEWNVRRTTL